MDPYDERLITEARWMADATPAELAAMLPASVYGDSPDSGTVMAYSFGIAVAMLREMAGAYENLLYRTGGPVAVGREIRSRKANADA